MKNISIILYLVCANLISYAQDLGMSDFKNAYSKIRALKRYTYVSKMTGIFPNGNKDEMKTTTFIDAESGKLAYKNALEHTILNTNWFYKVNFQEEFVSVFNVNSYKNKYPGAMGDLASIFKSATALDYIDTMIMRQGKLIKATKNGNISLFEFSFSKEADLKSFVLKFDNNTGLPQTITMKTVNEDDFGRKMEMNIICEGYSREVPETAFETSGFFSVNGAKVTLLKYKNYKLTSIL